MLDDLQLAKEARRWLELSFDLERRSFFLEVGRGELDQYVQVFQP